MKIGIPKERVPGETRVALIPAAVPQFLREGHDVLVESGAGLGSTITDAQYAEAGATIVKTAAALYRQADATLKVQPPRAKGSPSQKEAGLIKRRGYYLGFLAPQTQRDTVRLFLKNHVTSFAMEYVPRITRAQSMDALSSMATVAGYRAVLLAAHHLPKMFPLLMTAAGTIPPARVLVLGAGVAGLQAIATARRLGAKVEAFDPRPAVKEQVKSLGAHFIDMEVPADAETAGGYAKELPADFLKREQEAIAGRLSTADVVITTAQVFGKRAPLLITAEMVRAMKPGAVVVDLAAEQGGNCAFTQAGATVEKHGVTVIGAVNLPSDLPVDASLLYSKNITNLFFTVFPKSATTPNFEDEVVRGACITHEGNIMNDSLQTALPGSTKEKRS
jgi:NAD(P) transhydrogenase subunit alpha